MVKLKTINIPRKYDYKEGVSRPEYKKYDGWNKISYSQFTSFNEEMYRGSFIGGYMLGEWDDSGIFALYGSDCGDYVNPDDKREFEYLSEDDKKILDAEIEKHPENAVFEYEIVIDLEPFGLKNTVLQGFSDRQHTTEEGLTDICDYKTLNTEKKSDFYMSEEYRQTKVYGYGLEELGHKIGETYVIGLGRKGNSLDENAKHPMRLSGEIVLLDNPYCREKAIEAIEEIVKTCIEIDAYFKVYNKYFK